jgi:hypothetical protein
MTDLYLQDLKDLSSKELVHVLLNEQKMMFGEQKSHLNNTGDTPLKEIEGTVRRLLNNGV